MIIGPGTPLICISTGHTGDEEPWANLTLGAMYHCDEVIPPEDVETYCPDCSTPDCVPITLKEKRRRTIRGQFVVYCTTLFRPLNDGDTSLVEDNANIEHIFSTHAPLKETV